MTVPFSMAQQNLLPNNRYFSTSTVKPTRSASHIHPGRASPRLEEAQVGMSAQPSPNRPKSEPQSTQGRPTSLDWSGPDDPLNPHNWSSLRRWFQTYAISGVALVGTLASSVFTPCIEPTVTEFGSSTIIATLAYSIYPLGLAFGGPFAAPLSESFGRKPVIFISLPVFALFILGTGFAQNMGTLVTFRFFAGFFAAPSLSMGSGTLSDLWQPERRSSPMSMYVAAPFFGYVMRCLYGDRQSKNMQSSFGSSAWSRSHANCRVALDIMARSLLHHRSGDHTRAFLLGVVQTDYTPSPSEEERTTATSVTF